MKREIITVHIARNGEEVTEEYIRERIAEAVKEKMREISAERR